MRQGNDLSLWLAGRLGMLSTPKSKGDSLTMLTSITKRGATPCGVMFCCSQGRLGDLLWTLAQSVSQQT